jgi:hypothetical protein
MSTEIERYVRDDGKVAFIYSPGYGAGWSTWADNKEFMLFDKRLVELILAGDIEAVKKKVAEIHPDEHIGEAVQLKVEWVEKGFRVIIDQHGGFETFSLQPVMGFVA